ncbi:MAG TPA: cytochrome c3 family protein [Dongiaceae bacterium]|nr:cytochrome c3 family protein [Dongiaceae bacterium]
MLRKVVALIVFSAFLPGVSFADLGAGTGIAGSKHDMNAVSGLTKDALGRSCAFCHTPHNAQAIGLAPLWNHQPSTVDLTAYKWQAPANKDDITISDPLVGPSRLCMACHDGIVAQEAHGTASGSATGTKMTSHYTDALDADAKRFVENLEVTHPIGFLYADAVAKRNKDADFPELVEASKGFIKGAVGTTFNTRDRSVSLTSKTIAQTLYNGYMTCASCHDVHNSVNAKPEGTHDYNYFLYAKEEGSAICLSCHIK